MLVEVCANSLQSALNAERGNADRIELCSELAVGGVTPSYGLLKAVREQVSIPVHVLIRPRSGDFTYSDVEFDIMLEDIRLCVDLGFDGIVSGALHKDFQVDRERTGRLVEAAGKLRFTFHRAFDWVVDPIEALKELEGLGVDTILSSGQRQSALEGMPLLRALHENAVNCTIMPGGGIRVENAENFKNAGFAAVHLSGTSFLPTLGRAPKVSMNSPAFLRDGEIAVSDDAAIAQIVKVVK
ncbi:copper homeostasis protein CutC [Pseudozobellia thermophila]|uniref:PF03932 family protein CutC n=1 Tax=Pseudozobellia thermophila TaxID=192903 RepID=A0A1M6KHN1_9FLAO|nr:copper homeostasis protein CutC [Pseudozobellia thermophila]SHJ58401.1 copper homeostasis protein [Pseudozobellia thermophila]